MIDELHSKLKKLDSDEMARNSRASNTSSPNSAISSSAINSKLHKNLKKIKRSHGAENPTKNYYLAFPALSGNKMVNASKTATPANKASLKGLQNANETGFKVLSWSTCMKKPSSSAASLELNGKAPTNRRKKNRIEKGSNKRQSKVSNAMEIQIAAAKSFDFTSPKKLQASRVVNNKKTRYQRNNDGKFAY